MTTMTLRRILVGVGLLAVLMLPQEANAQLDPLLYLKPKPGGVGPGDRPTVLIAVDTAIRMQRDTNGDYRDPNHTSTRTLRLPGRSRSGSAPRTRTPGYVASTSG